MSELVSDSSELELEDENFEFIDGAKLINEEKAVLNAGESIPNNIDYSRLEALRDFNVDDFETKLYPVAKEEKSKKKDNKFFKGNSKFFKGNTVDNDSLDESMKALKEQWEASELTGNNLVNLQTTDIIDVSRKAKKEFINKLNQSINEIKEFIVNETSPTEVALNNAFRQSKQTLESILGIEVNGTTKILESMVSDAVRLKTFNFIADSLSLTEEEKSVIINKYFVLTVPSTNKVIESKSK